MCTAGDPFPRKKDRMKMYSLEEGGIWDTRRRVLMVISKSDAELRVCGKVERCE